jgi:hypothetical protein
VQKRDGARDHRIQHGSSPIAEETNREGTGQKDGIDGARPYRMRKLTDILAFFTAGSGTSRKGLAILSS